jgi:hypothetical protein
MVVKQKMATLTTAMLALLEPHLPVNSLLQLSELVRGHGILNLFLQQVVGPNHHFNHASEYLNGDLHCQLA